MLRARAAVVHKHIKLWLTSTLAVLAGLMTAPVMGADPAFKVSLPFRDQQRQCSCSPTHAEALVRKSVMQLHGL